MTSLIFVPGFPYNGLWWSYSVNSYVKSRARTKVGGVENGGGAIRRITGKGIHELVLITLELTTFVSIVYLKNTVHSLTLLLSQE